MKTVAIVQARTGSTRFPQKILRKINGKTLLEYCIERLKQCKEVDEVVVATTHHHENKPIKMICETQLNIPCFVYKNSQEHDVLSRYYFAAKEYKADLIIRVTSDCPFIDPKFIDKGIKEYKIHYNTLNKLYMSNTLHRNFIRGFDFEIFTFQMLKKLHKNVTDITEREHVTSYIRKNPKKYNFLNILNSDVSIIDTLDRPTKTSNGELSLVLDYPDDYALIKEFMKKFNYNPKEHYYEDILQMLKSDEHLENWSRKLEQKRLQDGT